MYWNKKYLLLLFLPLALQGQPKDSALHNTNRKLRTWTVGAAVVYGTALVGLNQLWYKNSERTSFHFFNDNAEWKQVDKLGHFYSAFHISHGTSRILKSQNIRPSRADLIGALTGFAVLAPIELFDGYSEAYGASVGDLLANGAGSGFYLLQTHLWSEVRIHPKYSFHRSHYAPMRPNVLGNGLSEEMIKDYNGQTYWLSFDIDKFMRFPKWLNLAVGYGAQGMVYARTNQNEQAGCGTPYRQYYLSLDLDLTAIKTNSKAVKTLLFFANMIKIPSPTLNASKKGIAFYPAYF